MKRIMYAISIVMITVMLSGCAVGMALYGKRTPNISNIRREMHRDEVIMTFGNPIKTMTKDDGGRIDEFEYQVGNDPSAGRAVGHAVMDVLTWGVWEIIGTPIEAFQGKTCHITIEYDKDDKVTKITTGESQDAMGN